MPQNPDESAVMKRRTACAKHIASDFVIAVAMVALGTALPAATFAAQRVAPGTDIHCDIEFAKLGTKGRLTQRTELITAFLHQKYAGVRENLKFMRLMREAREDSGLIFGDTENSITGPLNGITKDKSFVTSLTNKHKDLTVEMLRKIETKYASEVELVTYSDFKSIRYAFVPKKSKAAGGGLPADLVKDLENGFNHSNGEFAEFMRANKFEVPSAGNVENWFRSGLGQTADQAGFAARLSRDMSGANVVRNFNDPNIRLALDVYRKESELKRLQIIRDPAMAKLLNGDFVKADVLDLIKKSKSIVEAVTRLRSKYGVEISDRQIERLSLYNDLIDNFSPGIFIADRKVATLENAIHGGFSADFKGMSAKNRDATARAIAAGEDLNAVLRQARTNEEQVTKEFKNSVRSFNRVARRSAEDSVSSGDDFIGLRSSPWSLKEKADMIADLARRKNPADVRISFISEGVEAESRNILAAHGEAIEKQLRIELEGKIPIERLDRVVFGVDMKGKAVGSGDVSLLTGEGSRSNLNTVDRAEIETAFQRAVRKFNESKDENVPVKVYRAKQ